MTNESMLSDDTIIISYTRAEAIADGTLVDVSETAREAGISFPIALSAALHADISAIPASRTFESYSGRLWDVLYMFRFAIQRGLIKGDRGVYEVYLSLDRDGQEAPIEDFDERNLYHVKAVCGPGDDMEPVFTLMKVGED